MCIRAPSRPRLDAAWEPPCIPAPELAAGAQTLSFESWQDTMWNMVDAEGLASGWYFAALTIIGAFLLLNAFIAGIASVFMTLRRENQVQCRC